MDGIPASLETMFDEHIPIIPILFGFTVPFLMYRLLCLLKQVYLVTIIFDLICLLSIS